MKSNFCIPILSLLISLFIVNLLNGQTIVKGKVLDKVSSEGLIGVNIIVLNDSSKGTSTDFNGEFDLTVTTKEEVQIGETVTLQGKITLDKDFGAGYFYAIIVEDATLIK